MASKASGRRKTTCQGTNGRARILPSLELDRQEPLPPREWFVFPFFRGTKGDNQRTTGCTVKKEMSPLADRVFEIAIYIVLGAACWSVSWLFFPDAAFEGYALTAFGISLASCIGPLLWPFGLKDAKQDSLSVFVIMGFRFSVLLAALAISTATKWQHHNSFCNCLLGYYFPFLILQSAFLVRNQSLQHPPQS